MNDIELGDIGVIVGRRGHFCVYAGAALPSNIFPCSESLREAAAPAEALRMTDGTMCWRHEFTRLDLATTEQREAALRA